MSSRAAHLVTRFVGSLSTRPPSVPDVEWAHRQLTPSERTLWDAMAVQDRRHSIAVARRFAASGVDAPRSALAGALLHDVGKSASGLGTLARVLATLVGPRGNRFRRYHEHEALGAEFAAAAGSEPLTIALIERSPDAPAALRDALAHADDS